MASSSRLALTLLLLGSSAAASLAACGGDDDSSTTGQNDAGSPTTDGAVNNGPAHAVAASVTIYYGSTAKLDATGSTGPTGFTYEWALGSGPDGTASTLTDANTATPSLTPDRVGVYNLTLKVAGGGTTSTVAVTVTVVDPSVFYMSETADAGDGLSGASFNVVGAAFGNGGTPVSCFTRDSGPYTSDSQFVSQIDSDTWEGLPEQPAKLVYAFETREDGGSNTALLATTSNAGCGTPPTKLDEVGGGAPSAKRSLEQPKFSPSGNRIAYIRSLPTGATISTVGFDGSARRDLAPFYAFADGGGAPDAATRPPVLFGSNDNVERAQWVNESTIAWIQATGSTWQIASINDAAGATPSVLMTCPGTSDGGFPDKPEQFALLSNGDVLVSQTNGSGVQSLIVYTPDGAKNCTNRRDLSQLSSNGHSSEFSLSPDKSMIAFVTTPDAGLAARVRVIRLDGTIVSDTSPTTGSFAPRWVGAGSLLAWPTAENSLVDSGKSGTVIAVAQIDGGSLHQVTTVTDNVTTYGISNGWCSMGRTYGAGTMLFGMMGVLGLRLARRRRKG